MKLHTCRRSNRIVLVATSWYIAHTTDIRGSYAPFLYRIVIPSALNSCLTFALKLQRRRRRCKCAVSLSARYFPICCTVLQGSFKDLFLPPRYSELIYYSMHSLLLLTFFQPSFRRCIRLASEETESKYIKCNVTYTSSC